MVTESLGPLLPAEGSCVLLALDSPDTQHPVTEMGLPTGLPRWPATPMVTLSTGRPGARGGSPGAARPDSAPGLRSSWVWTCVLVALADIKDQTEGQQQRQPDHPRTLTR